MTSSRFLQNDRNHSPDDITHRTTGILEHTAVKVSKLTKITRNSPHCCHNPGFSNVDSLTSEMSYVCMLTKQKFTSHFLPFVTYRTACQYNLRIYSMKLQVIPRLYLGIHHKGLKKKKKNFCRILQCSAQHKNCKKAIPLQAWTGPEGSRRLRLPDFKTIGTWRG